LKNQVLYYLGSTFDGIMIFPALKKKDLAERTIFL